MEPLSSREQDPASVHDADFEPAPPPASSRAAEIRPFWFDVQVWLRDIFISVAIAAVVIVFLYQPVKVEGTSMLPQLVDEERVFVNKFLYNFDEINRGDVVVFRQQSLNDAGVRFGRGEPVDVLPPEFDIACLFTSGPPLGEGLGHVSCRVQALVPEDLR